MAKKVEKKVTSAQLITVDAGKLSQGLKHTFEGVAMVFDSLGMQVDIINSADFGVNVEEATVDKVDKPEPVAESQKLSVAETQEVPVAAEKEAEAKVEPTPVKEEVVEEPKAEPDALVENKTSTATPSVSVDDITKIIVQKIKQNRKNNEKIGAILKTYGASKVGELPEDKYEAFLTDLSAI